MEIICKYFLYFIIYSFLGWCLEVVSGIIFKKKFVNRGFLIGPYCPIYGWGSLAIILFVGNHEQDLLTVFLKAVFICSLLEYSTSYVMEKMYNVRWWDYSSKRFNINGRICLETMIPFGLFALILYYIIHPFITSLITKLPNLYLIVISLIIFIIYIIDNIITTHILLKIKNKIKLERKDNTKKIKKYIEKWIQNNGSVLYKRIRNAFPKFEVFKKTKKK